MAYPALCVKVEQWKSMQAPELQRTHLAGIATIRAQAAMFSTIMHRADDVEHQRRAIPATIECDMTILAVRNLLVDAQNALNLLLAANNNYLFFVAFTCLEQNPIQFWDFDNIFADVRTKIEANLNNF